MQRTRARFFSLVLLSYLSAFTTARVKISQDSGIDLFPHVPRNPNAIPLVPYLSANPQLKIKREQYHLDADNNGLDMPVMGHPVELVYGEDILPSRKSDPLVATIKYTPAPNRAMLLLEGYLVLPGQLDRPIKMVKCSKEGDEQSIVLSMVGGKEEQVDMFNRWIEDVIHDGGSELVVVTTDLMPGCGFKERNAFMVNDATIQGLTTTLQVTEIDWSIVGVRVSVDYGTASALGVQKRALTMTRRKDDGDEEEKDGIDKSGLKRIDFPSTPNPRLQIFPMKLPGIDIGLPFVLPLLSGETGPAKEDEYQGVSVTCLNCGVKGEIGFRGRFDADIVPKPRLQSAVFELNVTEDIVANVQLEFAKGDGNFLFEHQISLLPSLGFTEGIPLMTPPLVIRKVIEIGPYFDYSVGMSIEVGAPKGNVSFGGELRVKKGAKLHWDMINGTKSSSSGWDPEADLFPMQVHTLPGDINAGSYFLGVNFSSIPAILFNFALGIGIGDPIFQAGAKLSLLLPRVYTKSTLRQKVTDSCVKPGAEDFEFYENAVSFESGLYWALQGDLNAEVALDTIGIPVEEDLLSLEYTFLEHTTPFNSLCFVFGDPTTGTGTLLNASDVKDQIVLDVDKISAWYTDKGSLPPSVNLTQLSEVEGLPDNLKTYVDTELQQENANKEKDNKNGGVGKYSFKTYDSYMLFSAWAIVYGVGEGFFYMY